MAAKQSSIKPEERSALEVLRGGTKPTSEPSKPYGFGKILKKPNQRDRAAFPADSAKIWMAIASSSAMAPMVSHRTIAQNVQEYFISLIGVYSTIDQPFFSNGRSR